jgi:hypothetical protein
MGLPIQSSSINSETASRSATEVAVTCSAYGLRIRFETSSALSRYLPTPLIPSGQLDNSGTATFVISLNEMQSGDGKPVFAVSENGIQMASSADVETAARALESRAHQYVAANAESSVFVHAGVVSWQGKAIVLPGRSYCGKSTLVMALVNAGATYYSDEYAVLDSDGRVHPFRRLPRLRPDFPKLESFPVGLTHDTPLGPLPVGLVISTRYDPAGVWQPRRLTPGGTLLTLLENTVAVRRQAELSVRTLKNAVASAVGLQSKRTDAVSAAQNILQSINESWHVNAQVTTELAIKEIR